MYLDKIVDFINATVKTKLGAKASNSRFYGVCEFVTKGDEEKTVVLYDNEGNDYVAIDDTYSLIVYNRFLGWSGESTESNARQSFGDGASYKTAHANFTMGVYGDRKRLEMTDRELTASIFFNFPTALSQSLKSQLTGLSNTIISPSSTNNQTARDSEGVQVPKENIFFTINYRVTISGEISCFTDCGPDCV